jgi:hypothetical protein
MPPRVQRSGPTCIFCGQRRKMSREHVIPQWVSRLLAKDPRGFRGPVRVGVWGRGNTLARTITHSEVINMQTKRVCKVCNEGWMEQRLERPCQSVLGPLIAGEDRVLDPPSQALVAAWIAKTAMTARYAFTPIEPVEPDWLRLMYEHQRPPDTWHIWLGSYVGSRPLHLGHHDITVTFPDSDPESNSEAVVTPHGVLLTLAVGYAFLQVLGIKGGAPQNPDRLPDLFRIWPLATTPVNWPPPRHLDDASLPYAMNMFVDRPGEPPPPLPPSTS